MAKFIVSETRKYGNGLVKANADEVLLMLGLKPGQKLPREAMPERLIQNIRVYVKAQEPPQFYQGPLGRRVKKTSKHRIYAICECGKHVPVGRLHQHVCKPKSTHELEIDGLKAMVRRELDSMKEIGMRVPAGAYNKIDVALQDYTGGLKTSELADLCVELADL